MNSNSNNRKWQSTLALVALCVAAAVLGSIFNVPSRHVPSKTSLRNNAIQTDRRRQLAVTDVAQFSDPKSVTLRADFVGISSDAASAAQHGDTSEKETWFNNFKLTEPSIAHHNPPDPSTAQGENDLVVDVISTGCISKMDLMQSQSQTWASNSRFFWGFTEDQDFDGSCASSSEELMGEYIKTCRVPNLGTTKFGIGHSPSAVGWYCAQRRPGRELGWLQNVYSKEDVPDILIMVDDDTSVDIDKVKKIILDATNNQNDIPFIGAGSVMSLGKYHGFLAPHGGFGTFFNKAALQLLTQPIYCDERQKDNEFMANVCETLRLNHANELSSYTQGNSVFDIFYKHAASDTLCMHSDWEIGYMIQNYSGTKLQQVLPQGMRRVCNAESVSCHYQSAVAMENFFLAHPQMR